MNGFTVIDGVVAGVIIVSAILAYARGFVRETLAIGGWIIAAVLAFFFAPNVMPLITEIPYVGDFIEGSCELGIMVSFAAIFALSLVVISLFTPILAAAVQNSPLGGFDAGLGFLFGAARGVLLVVVALIAYGLIAGGDQIDIVVNSRSAQVFAQLQSTIESLIPSDASWLLTRYADLTSVCNPQ